MDFDRVEAKLAARASMRQTRPSPVLVTLVFLLLTAGLNLVIQRVIGNPYTEVVNYLRWGYGPEEVFNYVVMENLSWMGVFLGASLLLGLYTVIMDFGYTSYALRLARNEGPGFGNLFDGFARVLRVLWMSILVEIFLTLWCFLFAIPFGAVVAVRVVTEDSSLLGGVALWLALLFLAVAAVAVTLRYRLAAYFLLDDPDCTARQAIRRSKEAMKGRKMELLILDLSFFGWNLLVTLTLGILTIWVKPYQWATEANFYDAVVGREHTQSDAGSYRGPYRYDPSGS